MYNAKNYTDKLPKSIRQPLKQFAGNDCLLVKRLSDDLSLETKEGNCHFNVKGYVDTLGGKMLNGWLLCRNKKFMNVGMWVWSFHSIWLTDENELLDITEDQNYKNNTFTTFIPDVIRKVDMDEGINYNSIVIFDNKPFAKHFGDAIGVDIKADVIYWVSDDMMRVKELTEHSGQYRWLHKGYTKNHSLLYEKYGIAIVDNRVIEIDAANDQLSADVLFDFSLSCAA
jgi:hypothetical protein